MKAVEKPELNEAIANDKIVFNPIDGEMIVYKIIKKEKNVLKNIMRSFEGSMKILTDKWYKAEKRVGRDGSTDKGGKSSWYCTGIHCVERLEDAKEYIKRFRKKEERAIYKCVVKGEQWKKPTNDVVMLVSDLMFLEEIC